MSVWQSSRNGTSQPIIHGSPAVGAGPYDSGDATEQLLRGLVDFGSLLVPVPPDATARAQHRSHERWPGVHIEAPVGYLRLHALAAPRSSSLWDQLSLDIAASLHGKDARVSREQGQWGVEITCTSTESVTRFVGVDGPRWTLYGVATGSVELAAEQASALRAVMRGTVVVRGEHPFPVSNTLPLANPVEAAPDEPEPDAPTTGGTQAAKAQSRRTAPPPPPDTPLQAPAQSPLQVQPQPSQPPPTQPPQAPTQPPPQRAARQDRQQHSTAPVSSARSPRPPTETRPAASIPRQARSIGRLTRPADPPTEPIRMRSAAPRHDDTRRRLQQRFIVLEAMVTALHRHRELVQLIANAEDRIEAANSIRAYLDVGEVSARAILELPWHQLTAARRRAITAERDELRSYLYSADCNWS